MEECLSIWKNLDTVVTTYQSNILNDRGCRSICISPPLEILLTSLLSILSGSQGQDAYAQEQTSLSWSYLWFFYLVSLGFSPKWIAMPKPHFQYSECRMFAVTYSYCSSLSTTFGKAWFFWNLKLSECATQITNVFAENIGQVWSVFVAAVRILLE